MIINVCIGSACHLEGSYDIIKTFERMIKKNEWEEKLTVKAAFCLGHCTGPVSVKFEDEIYSVQPQNAEKFFNEVIREKVC